MLRNTHFEADQMHTATSPNTQARHPGRPPRPGHGRLPPQVVERREGEREGKGREGKREGEG